MSRLGKRLWPDEPPPFNGKAAAEAKLEVVMEAAIEALTDYAWDFADDGQFPLTHKQHRDACIRLCAGTFDRLFPKKLATPTNPIWIPDWWNMYCGASADE